MLIPLGAKLRTARLYKIETPNPVIGGELATSMLKVTEPDVIVVSAMLGGSTVTNAEVCPCAAGAKAPIETRELVSRIIATMKVLSCLPEFVFETPIKNIPNIFAYREYKKFQYSMLD
jgi:hypothetical protein